MHTHALEVTHLPLAFQPSAMLEGESSAAALIRIYSSQIGHQKKEGSVESELCTLGAPGS